MTTQNPSARPTCRDVRIDRRTRSWTCSCGASGDTRDIVPTSPGHADHETPTKEKR